eukprot:tig00001042_g6602.t1
MRPREGGGSAAPGAAARLMLLLAVALLPALAAGFDVLIRVTRPLPSAQLIRSYTYNVSWQVENELPDSLYDVDVFLEGVSSEAPSTRLAQRVAPEPIEGRRATAGNTSSGPVTYQIQWTITTAVPPGRYTVRARVADNNWMSGTSALFYVVAGVMSISTLPDAVVGGATQVITWSSAGQTPPVSLELRRTRLGLVRTLAANLTAGMTSFEWEVPLNLIGPAFYIQATAATDASMTASTPTFSIAQGRIFSEIVQNATALRPLGTYTIKWRSEGTVGNVSVILFDEEHSAVLLQGAEPDGSLNFQVPVDASGVVYAAVCSPRCVRATLGGGAEAALRAYENITTLPPASESVIIPAEVGKFVYGTGVAVTSPSGRDPWTAGSVATIKWRCEAAFPSFDVVMVDPQAKGAEVLVIKRNVPFEPPLGSLDWSVPGGYERGDRYGVLVYPSGRPDLSATGLFFAAYGAQSSGAPDAGLVSGTTIAAFFGACGASGFGLYWFWWRRRKKAGDAQSEAATSVRNHSNFLYTFRGKSMKSMSRILSGRALEAGEEPPGRVLAALCCCCLALERRRLLRAAGSEARLERAASTKAGASTKSIRRGNSGASEGAGVASGGGGGGARAPRLSRQISHLSSVAGSEATAATAVRSVHSFSQLRLKRGGEASEYDEEEDEAASAPEGSDGGPEPAGGRGSSVWGASRKYAVEEGYEDSAQGDELAVRSDDGGTELGGQRRAGRFIGGVYFGGYVSRAGGEPLAMAAAAPAAVAASAVAASAVAAHAAGGGRRSGAAPRASTGSASPPTPSSPPPSSSPRPRAGPGPARTRRPRGGAARR